MNKEFELGYLNEGDAESLTRLMTSNADRFKVFFPKTLEQNLSIPDSRTFISKKTREFMERSEYTFAIKSTVNGAVLGLIILKNIHWDLLVGELAYCMDHRVQGRGWMSAGVRYISRFAFDELGLTTLKIVVHKINFPSVRVAVKCGFQWQKTLKEEYFIPNESPMDMELYELTHER